MANQTTMQRILLAPGTDLSFLHEFPTSWSPRYPLGWQQHQVMLETLIRFAWKCGWIVELPVVPKNSYGDGGVDIIINGLKIDTKVFGLREDAKTKTFGSKIYRDWDCKKEVETEWFIFGEYQSPIETWEVARYKDAKPSNYKGLPPYFWKNQVMPLSGFAQIVDRRSDGKGQSTNWHNGACVTA